MLAWACCIRNYEVMKILWQERGLVLTPEYVRNLSFWKNKRRYSLLALAIAGCTSSEERSGFNVPDRFWRCLQYGSEYLRSLQKTLEMLRLMGIDFNDTICRGERNALFYAIREGRADVVRLLLAHNEEGLTRFDVFGIHKPKPLIFSSAALRENLNGTLLNQRQKSSIADAVKLAIRQGHHEIFTNLLCTREGEALESGPRCRVLYKWWNRYTYKFFYSGFQDASEYFPENVAGKVFFDTTNWKMRWLDRLGFSFFGFDGCMNYGLVYMSIIATSAHRDISFA
jgi:ankyrin repeat protein